MKNPAYMCITAVVTSELALAAGFSTFMPKYISNQFGYTASWSAMVTGEVLLTQVVTIVTEHGYLVFSYTSLWSLSL